MSFHDDMSLELRAGLPEPHEIMQCRQGAWYIYIYINICSYVYMCIYM